MHVFVLYHEDFICKICGDFPPLYISRVGSFQIKISFSAVTIKHHDITAKPVPTFFKLVLQTGSEQGHLSSEGQQRKGNKNAGAKQMPQHCPEKPGDKITWSAESWAVLSERRQSKKNQNPFLQAPKSKMDQFWLLAPSQGQDSAESPGHQPAPV